MLVAESEKDLAYVMKSNALKRKCDGSKKKYWTSGRTVSSFSWEKKKL